MEGYLAQIIWFGGNFAPRAWAYCQGQLLAIASNEALFSLIGTIYGGDGRTTFALPDFRGRIPVGAGNGPGLSNINLGQRGGAEQVTLTVNNLASHTHQVTAKIAVSTGNATTDEPDGNVLAGTTASTYAAASTANGQLAGVSATETSAGGNQPINIMQPYLGMNFIICIQGIYPSRS
ncbi:MAG: tail fiber protein [Saprospiraceae bacterium]|nr:phage tail protein [Lewinellaceae bacterium]